MKRNKEKDAVESKSHADDSKVPIEIDGKTFFMSFVFADLAKAERHFKRQGHRPQLLIDLPQNTLDSVCSVFPCLVHTHHPELTWEQAQALVTLNSAYPIVIAIAQAYDRAGGGVAAVPPSVIAGVQQ